MIEDGNTPGNLYVSINVDVLRSVFTNFKTIKFEVNLTYLHLANYLGSIFITDDALNNVQYTIPYLSIVIEFATKLFCVKLYTERPFP